MSKKYIFKFNICETIIKQVEIPIEANSKDEAIEKADDLILTDEVYDQTLWDSDKILNAENNIEYAIEFGENPVVEEVSDDQG
jgi:hypothetical protein